MDPNSAEARSARQAEIAAHDKPLEQDGYDQFAMALGGAAATLALEALSAVCAGEKVVAFTAEKAMEFVVGEGAAAAVEIASHPAMSQDADPHEDPAMCPEPGVSHEANASYDTNASHDSGTSHDQATYSHDHY